MSVRLEGAAAVDEPGIRVLLVEDHALVASALATALALSLGITVVGVVGSLEELDHLTMTSEPDDDPDVAVVDFYLGDGSGVQAAALLARRWPAVRVLMMSGTRSPQQVRDAIQAGCVAFVEKSGQLPDLVRGIRAAARGETSFDADALMLAVKATEKSVPPRQIELSEREHQVLVMLADGLATEVIATELALSIHTVRNHVRNLTAKLGAHSRLEALSIAAGRGLIAPGGHQHE